MGSAAVTDALKAVAAEAAAALVEDGMIVGLGSGSTARFAVTALGGRVRDRPFAIPRRKPSPS